MILACLLKKLNINFGDVFDTFGEINCFVYLFYLCTQTASAKPPKIKTNPNSKQPKKTILKPQSLLSIDFRSLGTSEGVEIVILFSDIALNCSLIFEFY